MRFGILVFPGTWSEQDCYHAITATLDQPADLLWHKDQNTSLGDYDCLILPGGFSYGDYLRAGAIASLSPIMGPIREYADRGGLVLGICNGFQILCESGLLPGVLLPNVHLEYRCQWTNLRVERDDTPFSCASSKGDVLRIPISHGEGNYYAHEDVLEDLEKKGQVVFRYASSDGVVAPQDNPNGSLNNIAGVMNDRGNVLGMMPHPERCFEELLGGTDGALVLRSLFDSFQARVA